ERPIEHAPMGTPLRRDREVSERPRREDSLLRSQREMEVRLAARAGEDRHVARFRRRRLHGRLRASEAGALRWLARADRDGGLTPLLLNPAAYADVLGDPQYRPAPLRVGVAAELMDIVETLVRDNPWSMYDATMFVLCGRTPAAPV